MFGLWKNKGNKKEETVDNACKNMDRRCIYFMGKKYNYKDISLGEIRYMPSFPETETICYVNVDCPDLYHDLQKIHKGKNIEEVTFDRLVDELKTFINEYGIDIFQISINEHNGEKEVSIQTSKNYLKKV